MQYGEETTYHCRPSHSQTIEDLFMESLDRVVDAEEPQLNLQASVKREKLELVLILDSRCGRCEDFNTESYGRGVFISSARARERGQRDVEDYR